MNANLHINIEIIENDVIYVTSYLGFHKINKSEIPNFHVSDDLLRIYLIEQYLKQNYTNIIAFTE